MNATDKAEALRLVGIVESNAEDNLVLFYEAIAALRSLLSAQEAEPETQPSPEHWRQAIHDWYGAPRRGLAWDWIEQRARELARKVVRNG